MKNALGKSTIESVILTLINDSISLILQPNLKT